MWRSETDKTTWHQKDHMPYSHTLAHTASVEPKQILVRGYVRESQSSNLRVWSRSESTCMPYLVSVRIHVESYRVRPNPRGLKVCNSRVL